MTRVTLLSFHTYACFPQNTPWVQFPQRIPVDSVPTEHTDWSSSKRTCWCIQIPQKTLNSVATEHTGESYFHKCTFNRPHWLVKFPQNTLAGPVPAKQYSRSRSQGKYCCIQFQQHTLASSVPTKDTANPIPTEHNMGRFTKIGVAVHSNQHLGFIVKA